MINVLRFLAICMIGTAFATSSIASAQTYTTIDYPGATLTFLLGGPNPKGTSVGQYNDTSGVAHGFTFDSRGVFTSFDPPGSTSTTPNFINPKGVIVGSYNDAANVSHGFVLDKGQYTTIDFPGAAGTTLTGLNPSGVMSGFTCSDPACGSTGAPSINHSFIVSKAGSFSTFDPPNATGGSQTSTITPSGEVVGAYTDGSGVRHGYVLYHGMFFTTNFPGATFTFDGGVNPEGNIVGAYRNGSVQHSFLLSGGVFTSFDPPGAVASDATGINPAGIIVGLYLDSAGALHGFIRKP
jgi:hypothetical protein